jgi:CRP-like cAMP-binding protein
MLHDEACQPTVTAAGCKEEDGTMDTYRSITYADCAACPASHIPLLGEQALTRRELCLSHFRLAAFDPRRAVYNLGDPGSALFAVRRGLIKLIRYTSDGAERIVRLKRPGETFGLESLLGRPYQHRAVAATACEVCRMPVETILRFGRDNPEVRQSLLAQYENSVAAADLFLAELATGNAHARVARLLLYLASCGDESDAPLLGREDMGAMLGLTTETASRVIAEFRRKAVIELLGEHRFRGSIDALVGIATQ